MKSIETKLSVKEKVGDSLALAGWLFAIFNLCQMQHNPKLQLPESNS
jgi:hypothetical protein